MFSIVQLLQFVTNTMIYSNVPILGLAYYVAQSRKEQVTGSSPVGGSVLTGERLSQMKLKN